MLSGSRFGGSILCKKVPECDPELNKESYAANDQHQKLERIVSIFRRKNWPLFRNSSVSKTNAMVAGCGDYYIRAILINPGLNLWRRIGEDANSGANTGTMDCVDRVYETLATASE